MTIKVNKRQFTNATDQIQTEPPAQVIAATASPTIHVHNPFANGLLGHRVEGKSPAGELLQGIHVGIDSDGGTRWDRIVTDKGEMRRIDANRVIHFGPPTEPAKELHPLQSELSVYLESNGWLRGSGVFFRNNLFGDWLGWEDEATQTFYFGHEQWAMDLLLGVFR